jgi:hypothetical protein
MRQSALALEGPPEKRFRGRDILLGAEQEIDSLSFFVDRAVKISPAPLDLHIGFVDSPGGARSAREAVPAPFEVRNIALDPAHYRRMGQRNPAFDHHFHGHCHIGQEEAIFELIWLDDNCPNALKYRHAA